MSLLEVKDLKKSFPHPEGEVKVLRGMSFNLEKGDTLAVVGVSGAGKSTLLHLIGGLDRPTSGKIFFDGVELGSLDPISLATFRNKKIGFVFQFHHLLPEFDALENVMMPALIGGYSKQVAKEKAQKILSELGLSHRIHHRLGELSGGEQQRVAVARAMILEPKLLLADEPTGNLDSETGKKVEDLLLELNRTRGVSIIVATHNEGFARRMKRRIRLQNGLISQEEKNT